MQAGCQRVLGMAIEVFKMILPTPAQGEVPSSTSPLKGPLKIRLCKRHKRDRQSMRSPKHPHPGRHGSCSNRLQSQGFKFTFVLAG